MKIVSVGSINHVYSDDLQTHDQLPVGTYKIQFNSQSGFSLKNVRDMEVVEEKIYGHHHRKIEKVCKAYDATNRSLGVLLSGDKGIGKSLFVQLVVKSYIEKGYPVIIVDESYPGIVNYIDSIEQEIVVIFDEFEKKFKEVDDGCDTQHDMLGLLDGTSNQKRLYIATINRISDVSEYLINRPGRFHYHFRFDYPSYDEIIEYLNDVTSNVDEKEIKKVADFSHIVKLNFDILRAIAFELNLGNESFEDIVKDLNILSTYDQTIHYNINIKFNYNGHILEFRHIQSIQNINQVSTLEVNDYQQVSSNYQDYDLNYTLNMEDVQQTYDRDKIKLFAKKPIKVHLFNNNNNNIDCNHTSQSSILEHDDTPQQIMLQPEDIYELNLTKRKSNSYGYF